MFDTAVLEHFRFKDACQHPGRSLRTEMACATAAWAAWTWAPWDHVPQISAAQGVITSRKY